MMKKIHLLHIYSKNFSYEVLDISKINKSTPKTFTVKQLFSCNWINIKKIQKLEIIIMMPPKTLMSILKILLSKTFKGRYTIKSKRFLVSKPLYIKGHLRIKKL